MSNDLFNIKNAYVNWKCEGKFSFTSGYGATKAEHAFASYAALLAPIVLYFLSWQKLEWTLVQLIVASILALDMVGGVLTNSLGSMKRFLHSEQKLELSWLAKLVRSKFLFPIVHFQIFLAPAFFDATWSYAFFWYAFMMLSIVALHYVPLYMQRPVGLGIVMLSVMIGQIAVDPAVGLEWLGPIYIIKLVLSHGVREEPYRPGDDL